MPFLRTWKRGWKLFLKFFVSYWKVSPSLDVEQHPKKLLLEKLGCRPRADLEPYTITIRHAIIASLLTKIQRLLQQPAAYITLTVAAKAASSRCHLNQPHKNAAHWK